MLFSTGAFDIVSEFLPHISIILYRVYPDSHRFLRKVFRISCITTLIGTTAETILTMYLFGSLWDRWTIAFKVTTPMLHCMFASAQLWGSWNFYKMYQKQCRLIHQKEGQQDLEEGSPKLDSPEEQTKKMGYEMHATTTMSARGLDSRAGSDIELTRNTSQL